MNDYYEILGVNKDASDADIKTAYRKLAHKHHPDKAGGDEAAFKKVNEAYQVLSNKEKRAQYDRFGKTFSGGGGHAHGAGGPFAGFDGFDFSSAGGQGFEGGFDNVGDIFDAFFEGMGVRQKRRHYERGADLEIAQEITLEEAHTGTKKPISFKTYVSCEKCSGAGHFPKEGFTECSSCDGRGEIQETRKTFFGNFAQVKSCAQCQGLGKVPNKGCKTCSQAGRVMAEKKLEINIAAGIGDGQLIKIQGAGERGVYGAGEGDLYVRIRVKAHTIFMREGDNLRMKKEVSLLDVLLDKEISVKNIAGDMVSVPVPAGYRLGDELVVSDAGMPHLGGSGKGNLIITPHITTPKKLSKKAEELLKELKKEL